MSDSIKVPARQRPQVKQRDEAFAKRAATKIWQEQASLDNPYVAEQCRCHGYDLIELMTKRSFVDVLFLLFQGELPNREQAQLLEQLLIAFINPGPRHPATRAAMNAGIGKTDPVHILPISLMILGGNHLGAGELEPAIRWLRKNSRQEPINAAQQLVDDLGTNSEEGDVHIAPGFGTRFGGIDYLTHKLAKRLCSLPGAGNILHWADQFVSALHPYRMGWLSTGLAAAAMADLGFQPRIGAGLFQLFCAPGLFAHGIEQTPRPLTAMPFPDDAHYFIEGRD